ncbi:MULTISPECIES: HAMP domain-containing sensor histidine kinase [unclassified Streptomyces]|uniref:sensor histidine kinase n=1 Tax=unclassified Streptomyces TaxID=2593676 RepID=UPI000B850CC0|nr:MULTISPECIES: HAMP domain-containing sensor histidine kinase [unclassified Streptomyces]MYT13701.1 HAMP domain-containing protein [Streptomyces sp. SID4951]
MGSVRARAAAGATVVVALALIAAGTAVLLVLQGNLQDQAGLQAQVAARSVAEQIATGKPYDQLDLPDGEDHPVVVAAENGRVLAVGEDVRAVDGKRVAKTSQGAGSVAPSGDDEDGEDEDERGLKPGEVDDDVVYRDGTSDVDGTVADYRFAVVEAKDTRGEQATVRAGSALAPERDAVGSVRDAMLVGLPLLLVVVAGVTWLVTRRALRPVEGIRGEMAAITASTDLSRRVPVPSSKDEIGRLARTTNETLAALESSVERQRRFVADASHELRSPIASLRTQLEVGVAHPELLDVPGAVEDTVRLQRLAADLLLLARLDAGERPAGARVDLAAMVREESSQRVADRIPVRAGELASAEVAGSRGQLGRVLGNLLDNAQRHAVSSVRVAVVREGEWAVLRVEDDGPGVPESERERIFERFVRLDDARARDDGGAGLGLAIARDVAVRHGGSLAVRTGSVFELRLPVAG